MKKSLRSRGCIWLAGLAAALSWSSLAHAWCYAGPQAVIDMKAVQRASVLGSPTSDYISLTTSSDGCMRKYSGGNVYYNAGKAFEVHGAILAKFQKLGADGGFLGFPTTDETATPDTYGRYNHFEHGSIYWRPCFGGTAYEVHGLIRNAWADQGWEKGALGYPLSDELTAPDGVGRYSKFQGGVMVYHPTHGTWAVVGQMARLWVDRGSFSLLGTSLGYPKGPMKCSFTGCKQLFQKATLDSFSYDMFNTVDLRLDINRRGTPIRDQAGRPTCSVMTMTFLLDYQYSAMCGTAMGMQSLSEEYLNHMTNKANGVNDDGDVFSRIAKGYETYGIIPDNAKSGLVFDGYTPYSYGTWDTFITQDLINLGKYYLTNGLKMKGRFIKPNDGSTGLTQAQFDAILASLRRGFPVGLGRWHSMPIVGFTQDPSWDGGGYFILRNSYGTDAGVNGYEKESFKSIRDTANDAYVYERPGN